MLNLLPKYLTSEKIWFDNKAERVEHHAEVTTVSIPRCNDVGTYPTVI